MGTDSMARSWRSALHGRRSSLLLAATVAAGAALGGALLPLLDTSDRWGLALLTVLAVALERFGERLVAHTRVSVSAVPLLAAGVLYGESGAVPLAIAIAVAAWVFRDRPLSRLLFNGAQLTVAGVAAAATYGALWNGLPSGDAATAVAAAGAGLVMWAVSSTLVGAMVASTSGRSLYRVFRENHAWLGVHFAVMGVVGLGLALTWDELGTLGVVTFLAPLGVFVLALRQGLPQARAALAEARTARRLLAEVSQTSDEARDLLAARGLHLDV